MQYPFPVGYSVSVPAPSLSFAQPPAQTHANAHAQGYVNYVHVPSYYRSPPSAAPLLDSVSSLSPAQLLAIAQAKQMQAKFADPKALHALRPNPMGSSFLVQLPMPFQTSQTLVGSSSNSSAGDSMHSHDSSPAASVGAAVGLFKCGLCAHEFSDPSQFDLHARVVHGLSVLSMCPPSLPKPFHCSLCPKQFAYKGTLQRHLRIHKPTRPYSCTVCSKGFSRKDTLAMHQFVHEREKRRRIEKAAAKQITNADANTTTAAANANASASASASASVSVIPSASASVASGLSECDVSEDSESDGAEAEGACEAEGDSEEPPAKRSRANEDSDVAAL